jgi:DNA polymerase III sliding clamp (beta) subunit (PCNA family)
MQYIKKYAKNQILLDFIKNKFLSLLDKTDRIIVCADTDIKLMHRAPNHSGNCTIILKIEGTVINKGSMLINVKNFTEVIRKLKNGVATVFTENAEKNESVAIFSQNNCNLRVGDIDIAEHSQAVEIIDEVINGCESNHQLTNINDLLQNNIYACMSDEFRLQMHGVLLEIDNSTVSAVSTDSYVLSKTTIAETNDTVVNFFVPTVVAKALYNFADSVKFHFTESVKIIYMVGDRLFVKFDNKNEFPKYRKIIHKAEHTITFNKHELINCLVEFKRLSGKNAKVKFEIDGDTVNLSSDENKLEIKHLFSNQNAEFKFAINVLLPTLQNIRLDTVSLRYTDETKAFYIYENSHNFNKMQILMPYRY